ncbi:hypothetical protein ACQ0P8_06800 [Halodesulfovibrio aestuarii]|uniref:Transmembrane protein n=1 Tax=Halodesulfovibrio aestuarii TaxID=126333 RepID=A0A8G2FCF7_9BACT|nr:hypothetical protein [Halodesulfovibrio aestuarii]SHJ76690.1 hypothetical protein SAMN05660830_03173 [Halodesulfovibrio aestuarii]
MNETARGIRIDSYDYFGYLVPGMVTMLGFGTLLIYAMGCSTEACTALKALFTQKDTPSTTIIISGLVVFALLSYVMGHIAGTFSSMVYEKLFVKKVTQYPTNRLLNINLTSDEKWQLNVTRYFYLFFVTMQYVLVVLYSYRVEIDGVLPEEIKLFLVNHFGTDDVFILSVILLFVWLLAKIINEGLMSIPGQEGSPHLLIKWYQCFFLFFSLVFSLPMLLISLLLGKLLGMRDKFPVEFATKIKEKYNRIFSIDFETAKSTEVWWSLYWYVINRDNVVRARIDKFLSLYGFMRNLAFACWFTAVCISITHNNFASDMPAFQIITMGLLFCSIIFAVRFYYLYYNYYSKTIFRVFLYLDEVQPSSQPNLVLETESESESESESEPFSSSELTENESEQVETFPTTVQDEGSTSSSSNSDLENGVRS